MFEIVQEKFRKHPNEEIKLPKRATLYSAGYDIATPIKLVIPPHSITELIQTDLCVKLNPNQFLQIIVRSSIGFKKHLLLVNTLGIIDSDFYYNPKNGGNIGFAFYNYSNEEVTIEKGENILQGIVLNYNTFENEIIPTDNRIGGIGSTNI